MWRRGAAAPYDARFAAAARAIASAARASPHAVCETLYRSVHDAVPAIDGALAYEAEEDALRCTFAFGERVAYYPGTAVALGDHASLAARALRAGHRVTLREPGVQPIHPRDADAVAVPLDTAPWTIVAAFVARAALDPAAIDHAVALAGVAAPSLALARDRERDRQTAEYDGLTGLLTPRAFRRRLHVLVDRARTTPATSLALMFVDTDHFKRWNDTFGHTAGDALLRRIAGELRTVARERDLVARNGGDEFCLVLADAEKAAAIERAELLRRRIAAIDGAISASIGVAAFPADASGASDLLERADAAMYHAKATGRNGVAYRAPDGALARLTDAGT